jgi:hypothetical protein
VKHILHRSRRCLRAALSAAAVCIGLAVSGCGSVTLVATANIPEPLITKVPVAVALYELGKAQTEGITRLVNAMFERVVPVDSVNAGTQLEGISAILEPSVEEYAFVTPRDAGTPFFAVSIKYRVNVYSPDGRLADSWGFTGYGTAPSQGLSSSAPLAQATALAMRDAGAKLAVEFREQAIVRSLLPRDPSAEMSAPEESASAPASAPEEQGDDAEPKDERQQDEQEQDAQPEPVNNPASPLGSASVAGE